MSFFRNVTWFIKGMREYTHSGYVEAAKRFVDADLNVNCSGKSFMITGANSGIGKQAAIDIATRGGTVHMVCRNPDYANAAKEEIVQKSGNDSVYVHILDMSKPKDIYSFVKKFSASEHCLDVLVNNAGCMVNTRELTDEGLEKNFATNTLGTYMITKGLKDLLLKAHEPRVITVSSGGMLVQKLKVSDLQSERLIPFDGTMVYAQNKRHQVVMTERWAAEGSRIMYYVMHPGWADTPAVRNSMPEFHRKMEGKLRSIEEGADTITWLALSDSAGKQQSGLFWQDRTAVSTHLPLAWTKSDKGDEEKLMSTLDELNGKYAF